MAAKIAYDRLDYQTYFEALAQRMGLKDWQIQVKDESPSDRNALASIWYLKGRKIAEIRLSEEFLRDTEENQRQTTAHELVHAHFAVADYLLQEHLDSKIMSNFMLNLEYGIDGIADAWAQFLPLPSDILGGNQPSSHRLALPVYAMKPDDACSDSSNVSPDGANRRPSLSIPKDNPPMAGKVKTASAPKTPIASPGKNAKPTGMKPAGKGVPKMAGKASGKGGKRGC